MLEKEATDDLLARIEVLQNIQATHPPTAKAWQTASELLAPLFREMARRTAAARTS